MMNRFSTGILLFSASVFLTSVTTFAQISPGAQGSQGATQQPAMPNQQPSTAAGTLPPDSEALNPQAINDQDFVRKALEGGAAEVQLGQLAEQKSQSADVKQFGQKMVQDHTQLGDQVMKPVAKQLGVKEPNGLSKKDKQLVASLGQLSGPRFDQEYIKAMVKDHKQDLKEFESEAKMSQDPNVKKAAEEGTTVISQHLQMIEQIAQTHNVAVDGK
jgi:putative membrane protein